MRKPRVFPIMPDVAHWRPRTGLPGFTSFPTHKVRDRPRTFMVIPRLPRIFAMAWSSSLPSGAKGRLPLEKIRQRLHEALHDCKGMGAQRAIYNINVAETPAQLWHLRTDLHQCIARAHSQAEADRRINALLDTFSGWIPSAQLTRI